MFKTGYSAELSFLFKYKLDFEFYAWYHLEWFDI